MFKLIFSDRNIIKSLSTLKPNQNSNQLRNFATNWRKDDKEKRPDRIVHGYQPVTYPELDTTFSSSKEAFKSKTNWEVFRACFVFHLLTIDYLVDNQMTLMKFGRKVMGQHLFEKLMKATFFGHFVAGVDENDIAPTIRRMRKFGVNAILDYSAEEDVANEGPPVAVAAEPKMPSVTVQKPCKRKEKLKKFEGDISGLERKKKATVRTYFYKNEAACDKNMEIFLNSIKAVAGTTDGTGFAAIKITALTKPSLLLRVSEAIEKVHEFVEYLTGVNDCVNNQSVKLDELKAILEKAAKDDPDLQTWIESIDCDAAGIINLLPWKSLLLATKSVRDAMRIPNIETGKLESISTPFSDEETEAFENAGKRCHKVFTAAKDANVRIMVDAEQTYLQPAISRLTLEMMKIYNTESAVIFNTYQCYLKESYDNVITDLKQAERQKFYFGAKLVRGAYMEQERERAESMGYEDPINPTYEATTEMYIKCMQEFLVKIQLNKQNSRPNRIKVMAASHNEDTVRYVINKMKEFDIKRADNVVFFGQLYGMCDQISFPMGQAGYQVYKYVPYGPVAEVLPYLSRRAQENRGFFGKTGKERKLLRWELLRRFITLKFFYSPDK